MKYIAFLRGINVGGNKKVDMKTLKKVFETIGCENVSTYINSGNVIFESNSSIKAITDKVHKGIRGEFGFDVSTLVLEEKALKAIEKKIPKDWQNDKQERTDILFLWSEYDKKSSLELIKTNPGCDNLIYTKGAIIWNVLRKNVGKSGLRKFIGSTIYKNMTARNVNTVRWLSGR